MLFISLQGDLHIAIVVLLLTVGSTGAAIADVTIDACVAQNSASHPSLAADLQSLCALSSSIRALNGFSFSCSPVHLIDPQLRKMLDLLVHASLCRSPSCQYPNCRKAKGLFRHGIHCKTRASRGCLLCKKMWYLLQLHARACKESRCHVPLCRDLNEHMRRLQQQAESRRRAAVTERMRQRAAEVSGNNG